ncbi:MAG: helix-turn-helix transcriptional regulator [Vicinamibacterales bacterium]
MSKPGSILPRYISPKQLREASTLSPATIWREVQAGRLPKPIRLTPGRVGWRVDQILAWLESRTKVA